jgi:hypothetical protein
MDQPLASSLQSQNFFNGVVVDRFWMGREGKTIRIDFLECVEKGKVSIAYYEGHVAKKLGTDSDTWYEYLDGCRCMRKAQDSFIAWLKS